MAEAKEVQKVIEETVIVKKKVSLIVLEISEDEAKFLQAMMSKVSGSQKGLRGHATSISKALEAVVGKLYFTQDSWFDNDYYRDGTRNGFSFGTFTSVDKNITNRLDRASR